MKNKSNGCVSAIGFLIVILVFVALAFFYRDSSIMTLFIVFAVFTTFLALRVLPETVRQSAEDNLRTNLNDMHEFALVIAKTTEVSKEIGSAAKINTIYYVAFQFSDGSRKNFNVDVNTFNTIAENDSGTLTYRQSGDSLFFVAYTRNNK
jgi:hypothetical protein